MQISRQQRINGTGPEIVEGLRANCESIRRVLKDGIKLQANMPKQGLPAFECTGAEIKEALGENLGPVETVLEFVLDGKSNKITKAVKANKT